MSAALAATRHWLLQRLDEQGDQPALIAPDATCSYRELTALSETWRRRLQSCGVAAGESIALVGACATGSLGLLLALIANRNVIVPVSPLAPVEPELLDCAGVGKLFELGEADGWTLSRRPVRAAHPLLDELRREGDAGLVLFTSGSTGRRKACLLGVDRLLRGLPARPGTPWRAIVFMSLDHIGGVNTVFRLLSAGGVLVPLRERTPDEVCQAIARHRVELLPTTPTFLRMLLISQAWKQHDLSSLRLISYGAEPMPQSTLMALVQAFPWVRLKQTYGSSELGILPTSSPNPAELWMAVGGEGCETQVLQGRLRVRARSAMLGYLNAPAPFDAGGWLDTGDLVEVKGGVLRVCGRDDEVINVGGEKVHPAEVEDVLLQMDNVRDATVYARLSPVTGRVVAARVGLFQPEDVGALDRRMRTFCRGRLAPHKVPALLEVREAEQHASSFKKIRPLGP